MSTIPLPDWNEHESPDGLFKDEDSLSEFPDYPYQPLDDPFIPTSSVEAAMPITAAPGEPQHLDGNWSWHDAALVGIERPAEAGGINYEVGCVDLYTDAQTGDLGGNYLALGSFADVDEAANFFHTLQREIHDQLVAPFYLADFAAQTAARTTERGSDALAWIACSPAEYAAYEEIRSLHSAEPVVPLEPAFQDLLNQITDLDATTNQPDPMSGAKGPSSTFQALHAIGLEVEGFDPEKDPPPFFDEQTNTAYWIGVFQPDSHDSSNCVASILSLARDPQTWEVEAQLAPCVSGDWDKAYQVCEHLLDAVEKGGIEHCFDTAESMALAADQRERWTNERGVSLERTATHDLAEYTRSVWEIDL